MRSVKELQKILKGCPKPPHGRGVSAGLAKLRAYMRLHGLRESGKSALEAHVRENTGSAWRVVSYTPGSIKRISTYLSGYVVPAAETDAALRQAEELGIRTENNLVCSILPQAARQEWRWIGQKWCKVRVWHRFYGELISQTRRIGKYSISEAIVNGDKCRLIREFAGNLASSSRKVVEWRWIGGRRNYLTDIQFLLEYRKPEEQWSAQPRAIVRALENAGFDAYLTRQTPEQIAAGSGERGRAGELTIVVDFGRDGFFHVRVKTDPKIAVGLVREAQKRRRDIREIDAAKSVIERAEIDDIWVRRADSLAAGNCVPGTDRWIAQHHLTGKMAILARELLAMANGSAQFVRSAVIAAIRRHKRECETGICELS